MSKLSPKTGPFDVNTKIIPQTEGIKYAGSKKKLIPQILTLAKKSGAKTVLDGFSGSTRVSQAFASSEYNVISSDKAIWSEVFGQCYLKAKKPKAYYEELIAHLNALPGRDGWFSEHYGGFAHNDHKNIQQKMPWQIHNTRKLDSIREEIDNLQISFNDKCVAITSLILAMDRVDSTIGHFSSYLREWSPRSYNNMTMKLPKIIEGTGNHSVIRGDIFDTIKNEDVDLAYFDPPYGSNNEKMPPSRVRYSSYYHVWTTICLNDKPNLFGKVNRRQDSRDNADPSVFEEYRKNPEGHFIAVEAIKRLITEASARYIMLSYSSGGRATAEELYEVMNDAGELVEVIEVDHKENVMASMVWTNDWLRDAQKPNREFIFLLKKR
ncbi:DNA adenine methylase [Neokomagataea thailandica]|uniref:site-specific DNA-methyltransferase (adenine-specific) n=1 Tax=Neokomagataea tanensis NBRC 106556 TaxID=1223519 RepID=A0ABQ0QHM1_9PROT|nr:MULTISPECIES: DNA adenine methylase [Neokomagataea]GBR45085.1 site-specific DNA-methyltransferase [Neokomagataea tanensis NBRC 106556]